MVIDSFFASGRKFFLGKTSGGLAKCRMFAQPNANGARGVLKS